jgi:GNAT superfamily N-acetyltransferase
VPELVPPSRPLQADAPGMAEWATQVEQYPAGGPSGLGYFAGVTPLGTVDCLLWRNEAGEVVGILNHYPFRTPEGQEPGSFNIWVKPGWQRRGIATRLANEALRRWTVDLTRQTYTPEGAAATMRWLARQQPPAAT